MLKENELWCVIFVSTGIKDTTPAMLEDIVKSLRAERERDNVSGLTIFSNGNILVLIEGNRESVENEFQRAKKHSAHHSPIKLYAGSIPYCFFEGQPLALKVNSPDAYKHLDTVGTDDFNEYFEEFRKTDHIVPRIVSNFINNNF
jgi:hypothetical protein